MSTENRGQMGNLSLLDRKYRISKKIVRLIDKDRKIYLKSFKNTCKICKNMLK